MRATVLGGVMADYAGFAGAAAYFELVRGALGGRVEGAHFFDAVADDIVYEVLYDFPGWPRVIRGRDALMARFRGYGDVIRLHGADRLVSHVTDDGRVLVIEYEVHGTVLATGRAYDNRFCSVITITDRRVSHWRDYMDSLAAWKVLAGG